jgi:hypothetical protein
MSVSAKGRETYPARRAFEEAGTQLGNVTLQAAEPGRRLVFASAAKCAT